MYIQTTTKTPKHHDFNASESPHIWLSILQENSMRIWVDVTQVQEEELFLRREQT